MEDIKANVQVVRSNKSPSKTIQPNKSPFQIFRRKQSKRLSTPHNSKHPLVQQMLLRMSPPSPVKIDSDQEQSKEGDIIQLRRQKYEINTPQRLISFRQHNKSQSSENGMIQQLEEKKESNADQISKSSENKSILTSSQNILFMKSKENFNCIPSSQAKVIFKKVNTSSIMQKRKQTSINKVKNQDN